MAGVADSEDNKSKTLEDGTPWMEYAVQKAQFIQKTIEETFESAVSISKSRLSEIRSTSSAHFHQTIVLPFNSPAYALTFPGCLVNLLYWKLEVWF